ncbi:MAG: hypothetical protein ACLFUX_02735 [Spirochaetaceae bacterium]
MPVKDNETLTLIEQIADHFNNNLYNRYLRQAYGLMTLDGHSWNVIENLMDQSGYYQLQGYHYDELYDRVLALARFIYHARREIQPHLRSILSRAGSPAAANPNERILREMAVNNFASNLNILSDLTNKLYSRVAELDEAEHKGDRPVYRRNPELQEVGRYLVPRE